jgi:hypothetical protein
MKVSREQNRFAVEALARASGLPAGFGDVDLAILDWIAAYRCGGVLKKAERPAVLADFTPHFDRDKGPIH